MDFLSMKRKELQSLCKKHNIPANLTNLEMANELTSLLQEKEKPMRRGRSCLKKVGELASENDSDAVTRQLKKVRFSPENEMYEFVELEAEPVELKRGARRKSIMRPTVEKESFVIENVDSVKPYREIVKNPVRTTRSRAQKFPDGGVIEVVLPIVEAKRTKRVMRYDSLEVKESVSGDNLPPVVDLSDNLASDNAAVEENRVSTRRSLRNREVLSKKSKDIDDVKPSRETVENPIRTAKSQAQKFPDGGVIEVVLPIVEKKRTKRGVRSGSMEVKEVVSSNKPPPVVDLLASLASDSAAVEESRVLTRRSSRNILKVMSKKSKEVEEDVAVLRKNQTQSSKKRNAKTTDEISEDNGLAADGGITQPEKCLRRSKRNVEKVEDYALLNRDSGKNEMVGRGRNTWSRTQLVENAPAAESGVRTETEVEVHGKLEVVLQLEEPARRPVRNGNRLQCQSVMPQVEKVGTDGAKQENENRKLLRHSALEGASSENLEENDVRSRYSRHKSVAISDPVDRTANTRKIKPRKSRKDPILAEESVVTKDTFVEEPPRRSACNAAKTDIAALAVGRKKLPSRSKPPIADSISVVKETPILYAQLSMSDTAESAIDPVLNRRKVLKKDIITSKKRKEFSGASQSKEVSAKTSDSEEAKVLKMANSVEIPAPKSVKLQNDHAENGALFSVSGSEVVEKVNIAVGVDKEKPLQDNISSVDDDDSASHSCKRSRNFDSNDLVDPEPEEDLNASSDVGFPQATCGDDQLDCVDKLADNLDLGKEIKVDQKPTTGKYIDSCCVVAHHGVDDRASVLKEQNLVELEDGNSIGEPIKTDLDAEGLLVESNESRSSEEDSKNMCEKAGESVVDHPDSERVIPSEVKERERDDAENSAVDAEGEESANCSLRMLNIEVETLLTRNISAFKGPPVTDSVMSELEVAEGASNLAWSGSKKVSEDTNIKRKGSSWDSSLNKQNHSMGVKTKSPYLNEIRGLILENLEGTPAPNSLKLLSDSAQPEREIPASESLVATEKENIVLVSANQILFPDDMLEVDEYSLASWSQNRSGGFDSKTFVDPEPVEGVDKVGSVIITESTCTADCQLPVHQAENVDGDVKCSVLEAQNFIEFQAVRGFSDPSTYDRVCEGHSTGPDESEGAEKDCENDSKKAVDFSAFDDPSHGERNTPNMVEQKNDGVQSSMESGKLQENFSVSNVVTAGVVSEKVTDFQLTNDYCSMGTQPLIAPECQGNKNHVELKANSNYDTEFHHGIMSGADTSASDTGGKICGQERIEEALPEMENKFEVVLSVERALHPVDEEIGHEGLEGNSLRKSSFLPILNELDGQLTKDEENAGSETNSLHNSEELEEKSMSKFTNGKINLFISVERDTDPTADVSPINTPRSSFLVNDEIMSSSEHASLKDVNESGREDGFKTLFATPANNTFSNEEESSDHEPCQSLLKSNLMMEEQSYEFTESAVNEGAAAEDAQMDVEGILAELNECRGSKEKTTNFCEEAGEISVTERDEVGEVAEKSAIRVDGQESDNCSLMMLNIEVETQLTKNFSAFKGPPVTDSVLSDREVADSPSNPALSSSERVSEDTRYGSSGDSSLKKQHHSMGVTLADYAARDDICSVFEVQNSVESQKFHRFAESSTHGKRTSLIIPVERETDRTEETLAPIITPESSLVVNNEIMSTSEHTPLKDDNQSRQEDELKTLFATPANNTDPDEEEASSHETEMDDLRMQEDSTISNVKNERKNFGQPQEVVGLTENEDEKIALPIASEEVTDKGSDGNEDVEVVPELDKSASIALNKLTNRKGDEDLVEISDKFEGAVPQVDDVKFNDLTSHKVEMAKELNQCARLTSHEFVSPGYKHGEDLEETSTDVAGTKVQVEEMKLDDLDSHKDIGRMEGNLNIKDKNTDAEEDVSPGYSNHYSEHEKVCSPLNVSDCDGNAPSSTDKSIQEDKDVTKETIVDDKIDNVSSDATDGSNVEENVKSSQTLSKEQLPGNEDTVEEDTFMGDISCLASNETKTTPAEADAMHWSLHNFNDMVHCAVESNEYAEQQNISLASTSTPAVNDDCAAVSSYGLAACHGTMGYGASELSLESNMFSSWEINLFLGDDVMKSTAGISETHFTCKDSVGASETRENENAILSEEHLDHREKVVEPNGGCFVLDESNYFDNESVKVEKSSVSIHEVILTEVSNIKGSEHAAASVDLRVGGDLKCPEGENIANAVMEDAKSLVEGHKCKEMIGEETELCEAVTKSNSMIEDQSSEFTDWAVDGGTAAEDAQLWQPNSEMVMVKNPLAKVEEDDIAVKQLNSMAMKTKNDRNRLIQGTPKKLITTLDMKENATSIKRDHVGSISVRSTAKRRALEDLRNK